MSEFYLESPYQPSGDQPQAIEKLVASIKKGSRYQTLIGVTGSGKTYTMAQTKINLPTFSAPWQFSNALIKEESTGF